MSETIVAETTALPPRRPRLQGPAVKLGSAVVLILLLQIPLLLVSGLISERQSRQQQVVSDISSSWGPAQTVLGPTLSVPYDWTESDQGVPLRDHRGWIQVPTSVLSVTATLAPETRRRGLFHATVYTATVVMDGTITIPTGLMPNNASDTALKWNEAVLAFGASDLRGQRAGSTFQLNGKTLPVTMIRTGGENGGLMTAPAGLSAAPAPGTTLAVKAQLILRGTESFAMLPWGQQIDMRVSAPWTSPSFTGAALPMAYEITPDGFHANWEIAGDAMGGNWHDGTTILPYQLVGSDVQSGVDLLQAVPTYQMVTRAAKYGTLFLVLAFLTYFLIEQSTGLRIHLAQYALLGLSVTLFSLLLVATAEPFGFNTGYALSTVAVMAQASLYTFSVTGRARLAGLLAALLGLLFGVLYVILRLETYALLAGAVILFIALSVVMIATRQLDWSGREARAT